jgi:hypothetical protein
LVIDISITKNVELDEWDGLLADSKEATIFHTFEFMKAFPAYPRKYNEKMFAIARNRTGQLVAGMPFAVNKGHVYSLLSLPFGCYGGVVFRDDAEKELRQDVLKSFCNFAKKCTRTRAMNRIEITDFFNTHECLKYMGFERKNAFAYIVDLESSLEHILMNKVDKKARSQIRQALRKGLTIKEVNTASQVEIVCDIIGDTAQRHGVIPEPNEWVSKDILTTLKTMGGKELAKYLIAYLDDVPLAYALQLMYKDFVFYAGGGSYEKYWELRPNNLLIWSIIENGVKNSCKYLNFGSVGPEQSGLAKFKESWGANRVYYSIYEKSSLPLKIALGLKNSTGNLRGLLRRASGKK